MNKLNIKKDTKIYVACPANSATGGPELLHQLTFELNKLGFNASMFYYRRKVNQNPIHEAYIQYNNKFDDTIIDNSNNILIIPENKTSLIYKYKNIQKVIWWLSVDNYYSFLNSKSQFQYKVKKFLYEFKLYPNHKVYRFNKNDNVSHFVQCEYAKDMLENKGISNIDYLSDYLNSHFIEKQLNASNTNKKDIILYNPKKGIEFTRKLINSAPDLKFVPIQNMTREEVAEILSNAKVYIDFGNHPGKDRIPREAVISGSCVITGKDGSAKFFNDVPINDEFKFDASDNNIPNIIKKIKECFNNFEKETIKFENYRTMVKNEQEKFINDIKNIFMN